MNNESPTPTEYSGTEAEYLACSRNQEGHRARVLLGELESLPPELQMARLRACVLDVARGNSVADWIYRLSKGKVPYADCFNPFGPLPPELENAFGLEDFLFEAQAKPR